MADGRAATGGVVKAARLSGDMDRSVAETEVVTRIAPDGRFVAVLAADTSYALVAVAGNPWKSAGVQNDVEVGTAVSQATASDVSGVRIATRKGATVSGVVIAAGGAAGSFPKAFHVTSVPIDKASSILSVPGSTEVSSDGRFELRNLFGCQALRAGGVEELGVVVDVRWAEKSLFDSGICATVSDRFADIKVHLGHPLTITGTVNGRDGRPTPNAVVVLTHEGVEAGADPLNGRVSVTRADAKGRFALRELTPGRYVVTALRSVAMSDLHRPEILKAIELKGVRLTLDRNVSDFIIALSDSGN